MLKKIIYLSSFIFFIEKSGFCDPVTAGAAIWGALSAVGTALGPSGVLALGGLGLEAFSLGNQPTPPKTPNAPAAPDPNAAANEAQANLTSQRQALLLSGGETTLTGPGGAPILAGSTTSKTLLGAG